MITEEVEMVNAAELVGQEVLEKKAFEGPSRGSSGWP